MVKFCVGSKYSGPTCYDIPASDHRNLRFIMICALIALILVLVKFVIYLIKGQESKNDPFIKFMAIAILILFVVYFGYSVAVTNGATVTCRGYQACSESN